MSEDFTYDQISSLFHLPLHEACIHLGVPKEELNKACRRFGVKRWPYSHKKTPKRSKSNELFVNFQVDTKPTITTTKPRKPVKNEHFSGKTVDVIYPPYEKKTKSFYDMRGKDTQRKFLLEYHNDTNSSSSIEGRVSNSSTGDLESCTSSDFNQMHISENDTFSNGDSSSISQASNEKMSDDISQNKKRKYTIDSIQNMNKKMDVNNLCN
eukprot:gene11076-3782_t